MILLVDGHLAEMAQSRLTGRTRSATRLFRHPEQPTYPRHQGWRHPVAAGV